MGFADDAGVVDPPLRPEPLRHTPRRPASGSTMSVTVKSEESVTLFRAPSLVTTLAR
jgi:hypothetical protein